MATNDHIILSRAYGALQGTSGVRRLATDLQELLRHPVACYNPTVFYYARIVEVSGEGTRESDR
jgi:hypothetical protein